MDTALRNAVDAGWTAGAVLRCDGPSGSHAAAVGCAQRVPAVRPMTADCLFDLASLTKVLATTWLSMKWADAGRLDLDAPLEDLRPGYYPVDKRALTVRLLMTHAAGLPSSVQTRHDFAPDSSAPGRRARVLEPFLAVELETEPKAHARYSDIGPVLVGDLLEALGGERLDRLCARELYEPLGLGDTFFVDLSRPQRPRSAEAYAATEDCPWRQRVVVGEVHDENAHLLDGIAGHAGLFSTAADVARIAAAFLAGDGAIGVSPATLKALTRPQGTAPGSGRAFGWDTPRADGPGGRLLSPEAYGHTGFTGTSVWIDPGQGLYIVLLANRVHPSRQDAGFVAFRPQLHELAVAALNPEAAAGNETTAARV